MDAASCKLVPLERATLWMLKLVNFHRCPWYQSHFYYLIFQDRDPYSIGKLSAKYQFCAIQTADNTDGKVTGGGKNFTAGRNLSRHRHWA